MTTQKGFAHAFLIIGLMVALVGALGFVFWQNFIYKEPVMTKTEIIKSDTTKTKDVEDKSDDSSSSQKLSLLLNGMETTVDVSDAKYKDIVAKFDTEKGYYDVYSKDLLARVNKSNGIPATSTSGCNNTIIVDTYSAADDGNGHYQKVGEANGKFVHAGFMGPCDPSSDEKLSEEMLAFRDYIKEKVRQALL